MKQWLIDHALANVWCQPFNDERWIIKPGRITPPAGTTYGIMVGGYQVLLPEKGQWFSIFQIGNLEYTKIGFNALRNTWLRLDKLVNHYSTLATIYNELGVTYPLEYTWVRKLPNNNILICVKKVDKQVDFRKEDLYVRFYRGNFRDSGEYNDNYATKVEGRIVRSVTDANYLVNKYHSLINGGYGYPTTYVNGYEVDNLTVNDFTTWDYVELVHDGLVEEVHRVPMANMGSFSSTMDGIKKYLLHLPKQTDTIKFINDIDLSLFKDNIGLYFHQHKAASLRQLTHNDFSIAAPRFSQYINNMDGWNTVDDLTCKVVVRRSAMRRPLVYNSNRILELYRLDDEKIVSCICGRAATLDIWTGDVLEKSPYVWTMSSRYANIDGDMVTDAYGYNAAAYYLTKSPIKTYLADNEPRATLPQAAASGAMVYEYDSNGLLLSYRNWNTGNLTYHAKEPECDMVEVYPLMGGETATVISDKSKMFFDKTKIQRFYVQILASGKGTGEFTDVTGTDAYAIEADGTVTWNIDESRRQPIMVEDVNLSYGFELDASNGKFAFSVGYKTEATDNAVRQPCWFTCESLDVWVNGKILVPKVDYVVRWPQIVICNKGYLESIERDLPWIDVRARGLANELTVPKTGFIVDHLISNNARYDISRDRVSMVGVGGSVFHPDTIEYREDNTAGSDEMVNGRPYVISTPMQPLGEYISKYTPDEVAKAKVIDEKVEDYLSVYYDNTITTDTNPVTNKQRLFSPIMNAVIKDMLSGRLKPIEDSESYYISTGQFDELMAGYVWLLDYDPTRNGANFDYVTVEAHSVDGVVNLTPLQYSIVERINDRYLNNKVATTTTINIKD